MFWVRSGSLCEAGLVRAEGPPTGGLAGNQQAAQLSGEELARPQLLQLPSRPPTYLAPSNLHWQLSPIAWNPTLLHLLHPLLLLLHPLDLLIRPISTSAPETGGSRCEAPSASHQKMVSPEKMKRLIYFVSEDVALQIHMSIVQCPGCKSRHCSRWWGCRSKKNKITQIFPLILKLIEHVDNLCHFFLVSPPTVV